MDGDTFLTDHDEEVYKQWMEQVENEVTEEVQANDPVYARFRYKRFVSKSRGRSKGRGRPRKDRPIPRKKWVEVELVNDKVVERKPLVWTTFEKVPFDTLATEVYNDPEAESEQLRQDIRERSDQ